MHPTFICYASVMRDHMARTQKRTIQLHWCDHIVHCCDHIITCTYWTSKIRRLTENKKTDNSKECKDVDTVVLYVYVKSIIKMNNNYGSLFNYLFWIYRALAHKYNMSEYVYCIISIDECIILCIIRVLYYSDNIIIYAVKPILMTHHIQHEM